MKLSVVVPCYNEEKNIGALFERFASALGEVEGAELILVDNGSTDRTGAEIDRCIGESGKAFARKVRVEKNQGYGFGILSGLRQAQGEVLAWTHADLQTDPRDVVQAYEIYCLENAPGEKILVKGTRKNRKFMEALFSAGMQWLASAVLGCRVQEINAQPKLFPRAFFEEMKNPPHDFSLDLYILYLARKKGWRIIETPVDFSKRQFGEAKGGSGSSWPVRLKLIRRSAAYIFELRSKIKKGEAV